MKARSSGGCDHLGLLTDDIDGLALFYGQAFGFTVERDEVLSLSVARSIFDIGSACRFVKLTAVDREGGTAVALELFQPLDMKLESCRGTTAGYNHWGLRVGDRAGVARTLRNRRVPVIEVDREGHSVFFVKDPDGNLIELRD
jgi:catechol 2,3-dioxygenase-like lactoylglutathione lyase family enzyme